MLNSKELSSNQGFLKVCQWLNNISAFQGFQKLGATNNSHYLQFHVHKKNIQLKNQGGHNFFKYPY